MRRHTFLSALWAWATDPPEPTFRSPRHNPHEDAIAIIHGTTQYLIDIRPCLRNTPYSTALNNELVALHHAAYAAIDTYSYTKGAP